MNDLAIFSTEKIERLARSIESVMDADNPEKVIGLVSQVAAAVALFRFKVGVMPLLAACAALGLVFRLAILGA